jgi:gamma-glutamyltranspeptidase
VSALKLWYNKTLKEAIDKPRIFHQLVPMQIQYEYGTTRVILEYDNLTKYYATNIIYVVLSFRM